MPEKIAKKKPNGTGRKKIEIKKIEKNSSRKVAFSKRRKGLFKKGAELCRLCDAMIAIIVFSPKGRVYTFGHPSPDYVIDHFLAEEISEEDPFPRETDDEDCVMEEKKNSDKETNEDDDDGKDVNDELEKSWEKEPENSEENSEKEPEISNDDGGGGGEEGFLWEESMEDLNVEELEKYKFCMEMFRYNLGMMVEEMMLRRTSERDLLGAGYFSTLD